MYTEKVMQNFADPQNVGEIPDADGVGEVGNVICGDILRVYIKVKDERLEDIKYMTYGCTAAVASGSMMTQMAKGMTIDEAMKLSNKDVAAALGGLPPQKLHCSNLAADTLHKAIKNYQGIEEPESDEDHDHEHDDSCECDVEE
jgi:nitrogen fixation NifU-like protein